jgi:hypothetical protein
MTLGRILSPSKQLCRVVGRQPLRSFNTLFGGPTMNPSKTRLRTCLATLALGTACSLALATLSACDDGQAPTDMESGEAMLSLATIPEGVSCVRVTVAGEFRATVKDFDVVAGDSLVQALSGLPVGAVVFSANAYAQACSSITKSTVPTWLSDEKDVTLVQGKSSSVTLTLYKNGRAKVTVDFADQEDGGTDAGAASTSPDGGLGG